MTSKQNTEAHQLLSELKETFPAIDWRATYNYYTKLPMIAGLIERGGYEFAMWRRHDGSCDMSLEYNHTTRAVNGMIASNGGADETIAKVELTRISWPRFMAFVREHAASVAAAVEA